MQKIKHLVLVFMLGTAVAASVGTFLYVRKAAAAYSLEKIIIEPAPPHPPQPEVLGAPTDPRLAGLKDRGDGARLLLAPAPGEAILAAAFASNDVIVLSSVSASEGKESHRVASLALPEARLLAHLESEKPLRASSHRPAHPNAGLLCYAALDDATFDIRCAGALGGGSAPLTEHDGPEHLVEPAVSPGGDFVAFQVDADHLKTPRGSAIWRIGSNRAGIQQLTRSADDRFPAWAPDGRSIYFQRRIDENWDAYVMDADGKDPRPILRTHDEDELWPTPLDARRLVMAAGPRGEAPRLKIFELGANKSEWLTSGAHGPETRPSVSPDGRVVLFLAPVDPDEPERLGAWLLQLD